MSEKKINPYRNRVIIFSLFLALIVAAVIFSNSGAAISFGTVVDTMIARRDYPSIADWVESDLLNSTEVIRYYRDLRNKHNEELMDISEHMTPMEFDQVVILIDMWMPNLRALKNGEADKAVITKEQVDDLLENFLLVANRASPSLHDDIMKELDRLQLQDFIGMTMAEAWIHLHVVWGVADPPPASDLKHIDLTPTIFRPTPFPTVILTPQPILDGSRYAKFWAEFRDSNYGFGFAFPADWILRSQWDGNSYGIMTLCNNDLEYLPINTPGGICIEINRSWESDIDEPFLQEAPKGLCNLVLRYECGPITLIPETTNRPAHVEFQFTAHEFQYRDIYSDPNSTAFAAVFIDSYGTLIEIYSYLPIMQSPEARAIIDSVVLEKDIQVVAPDFEPSKKVIFDEK
jgi:hypothetical protein